MDVDEYRAREETGNWADPWDPKTKTIGGSIGSYPIKCDPVPERAEIQQTPDGPKRVPMSVDFDKGRRLFRVVLAGEVLSTNRLYVVTWAPSGKVTKQPKVTVVYRYLGEGRFMPVRSMRVRSKEHKKWKKSIVAQLQASDTAIPGCIPAGTELYVRLWVHGNWRTKDLKKIRKKDLGNCEKALLDTIFEHLNADDSVLFTIYMAKVEDTASAFTVEIGTLVKKFGLGS